MPLESRRRASLLLSRLHASPAPALVASRAIESVAKFYSGPPPRELVSAVMSRLTHPRCLPQPAGSPALLHCRGNDALSCYRDLELLLLSRLCRCSFSLLSRRCRACFCRILLDYTVKTTVSKLLLETNKDQRKIPYYCGGQISRKKVLCTAISSFSQEDGGRNN